jgi:phage terminase large subunit-like protein
MQQFRAKLEPTLGRDKAEKMVLDIPQDLTTFDPAMKTAEALVLGQRIQHDGNPAMAWMVSNIVKEPNHKGEIYPRKAGGKDSWNKIDAVIAWFTALSQAMQQEERAPQYQFITVGRR